MRDQQGGFTLIELVIVIILLGILAAAITPRFQDIQQNARQAIVETGAGALESAALITFAAANGVPQTPDSIRANVDFDGAVAFDDPMWGCPDGADAIVTVEHVDDPTVQANATIPDEFCTP